MPSRRADLGRRPRHDRVHQPDDGRRQRRAELRRDAGARGPLPGRQARAPDDDDPVQRAPGTWPPASPRWRRRSPTCSVPPASAALQARASASRVSGCPIMTDTYVTDGRAVAEKALGAPHEHHGRHRHRLRRRPAGRRQPRQPRPAHHRRPAVAAAQGVRARRPGRTTSSSPSTRSSRPASAAASCRASTRCGTAATTWSRVCSASSCSSTWEAEGEKDLYERAVDEYRRLKTADQARRPARRRAPRHGRRRRSRRQGALPVTAASASRHTATVSVPETRRRNHVDQRHQAGRAHRRRRRRRAISRAPSSRPAPTPAVIMNDALISAMDEAGARWPPASSSSPRCSSRPRR